ncbi:hypothetical protein ROMU108268_18015 [Roseomonas mucosa]
MRAWRSSRACRRASLSAGASAPGSAKARAVAARSPARPGAGRGPRSAWRSRSRSARSQSARAMPPAQEGCFRQASRATGENSSATMRAIRRRKAPVGVWARGWPAESSASTPWRASSTQTRRARSRSGVTRAARLPGVSSASRSSKAMAAASPASSGAVRRVRWSRAGAQRSGAFSCQQAMSPGGRRARASRVPRASPAGSGGRPWGPGGGQGRRSPGVAPMAWSSRTCPQRGWVWLAQSSSHGCGGSGSPAPCRTTWPLGQCARTFSNSAAAGMVPPRPIPAAITRSSGGFSFHSAVWARMVATRRVPMSERPCFASQACHSWITPLRKTWVICQCRASRSGTREGRRAGSQSSSAISSSSVASSCASRQAWSGCEGPP